jgi:hypothetical protein
MRSPEASWSSNPVESVYAGNHKAIVPTKVRRALRDSDIGTHVDPNRLRLPVTPLGGRRRGRCWLAAVPSRTDRGPRDYARPRWPPPAASLATQWNQRAPAMSVKGKGGRRLAPRAGIERSPYHQAAVPRLMPDAGPQALAVQLQRAWFAGGRCPGAAATALLRLARRPSWLTVRSRERGRAQSCPDRSLAFATPVVGLASA